MLWPEGEKKETHTVDDEDPAWYRAYGLIVFPSLLSKISLNSLFLKMELEVNSLSIFSR
jgi:hypothetical protein